MKAEGARQARPGLSFRRKQLKIGGGWAHPRGFVTLQLPHTALLCPLGYGLHVGQGLALRPLTDSVAAQAPQPLPHISDTCGVTQCCHGLCSHQRHRAAAIVLQGGAVISWPSPGFVQAILGVNY